MVKNRSRPVVASADARPTVQSYAVFDKLAAQARDQLAALDALVAGDLAAVNAELRGLDLEPIGV